MEGRYHAQYLNARHLGCYTRHGSRHSTPSPAATDPTQYVDRTTSQKVKVSSQIRLHDFGGYAVNGQGVRLPTPSLANEPHIPCRAKRLTHHLGIAMRMPLGWGGTMQQRHRGAGATKMPTRQPYISSTHITRDESCTSSQGIYR